MVFFDVPRGGQCLTCLRGRPETPSCRLLIFGVVGVALFASFMLKASDDIVFDIVFIGALPVP